MYTYNSEDEKKRKKNVLKVFVTYKKREMVSRTWCFTLNNYSEEDILCFDNLGGITYLVYGKEVSSTGTHHLQGYLVLKKPERLSFLKKINSRAHWEPSKKSVVANTRYCSKEGDFRVFDYRQRTGPKKKSLFELLAQFLHQLFQYLNLIFRS